MITTAEATGTLAMPLGSVVDRKPLKEKAVIKKTAQESPDDNLLEPVKGEQPGKHPQSGQLRPHVDVTNKEPPKVLSEKKAEFHALPSLEMYPLDRYDHVKEAVAYFTTWGKQMDPVHRREFCDNLCKRAAVLRIPVTQTIAKYGGAGYAADEDISIALESRKNVISDDSFHALLDKLAEVRHQLPPEMFAVTLSEFDKTAGIDGLYDWAILDPYFSTYGKTAGVDSVAALDDNPTDQDESFIEGNEFVTAKALKTLSVVHTKDLKDTFGHDFLTEFQKDPVGIYKSLPRDQKLILIRLANDNSPK